MVEVIGLVLTTLAGGILGLAGKPLLFAARKDVPRGFTMVLGGVGSSLGYLALGGLAGRTVPAVVAALVTATFLVVVAAGATGT